MKRISLDITNSTNVYAKTLPEGEDKEFTLVTAEFQEAGRGAGTNSWESERNKNLLFSLIVYPQQLQANQMFALSEVTALAIRDALTSFLPLAQGSILNSQLAQNAPSILNSQFSTLNSQLAQNAPSTLNSQLSTLNSQFSTLNSQLSTLNSQLSTSFSIKWPNDIYYGNRKAVGMLIENDLQGKQVRRSIIGVGVNINQTCFLSDAPNPISLAQILGHEEDRSQVLESIMQQFTYYYNMMEEEQYAALHNLYMQHLYRKGEPHTYSDAKGTFVARIIDVEPTGHLILEDESKELRRYDFKEVRFMGPQKRT